MKNRIWLVTGSTSGFGLSLCKTIVEKGGSVVAGVRNVDKAQSLLGSIDRRHCIIQKLDVTQPEDASAAVDIAIKKFGRLDVVVNCAGYGSFGAFEEVPDIEVRQQFETNVFGSMNVIRAALPQMRKQRDGLIVQFSSLAGIAPPAAGLAVYASTKFAVEGLCEGLRLDVAHLGINVMLVEPGDFMTGFGDALTITPIKNHDYSPSVGAAGEAFATMNSARLGDPGLAAHAIIESVLRGEAQHLVLGEDALEKIKEKLTFRLTELERWSDTGKGLTVGSSS